MKTQRGSAGQVGKCSRQRKQRPAAVRQPGVETAIDGWRIGENEVMCVGGKLDHVFPQLAPPPPLLHQSLHIIPPNISL